MEEKNLAVRADADRIYWNAFAAFRLGAGAQRAVLDYFGSAAEAVLAREEEWQHFFGLAQGLTQRLSFTVAEIAARDQGGDRAGQGCAAEKPRRGACGS